MVHRAWPTRCTCTRMQTHTHTWTPSLPNLLPSSQMGLQFPPELAEGLASSSLPELLKHRSHQNYSCKWKSPQVFKRKFTGPLPLTAEKNDRTKWLGPETLKNLSRAMVRIQCLLLDPEHSECSKNFVWNRLMEGKGNAWAGNFNGTCPPRTNLKTLKMPQRLLWPTFWGSSKQLPNRRNGLEGINLIVAFISSIQRLCY